MIFWEKSSFEVFSRKEPKMCLKWGFWFFKFDQNSVHWLFWIFCMKFSNIFVGGVDFFLKFLAQKGTKIKLLKFYEISIHGFFLIISTKLQQKGSKLTAIFFWKILCWGFLTKKVPKLVLKLHKKSLNWIENDALSFFWFFHEVTTAQRQEIRQFF